MDISPARDVVDPPAAPDWSMEVDSERTIDGILYFADVKRAGKLMCRVALAGTVSDEAEARRVLASKARAWIDEYLARRPVSSPSE